MKEIVDLPLCFSCNSRIVIWKCYGEATRSQYFYSYCQYCYPNPNSNQHEVDIIDYAHKQCVSEFPACIYILLSNFKEKP